MAVEVMLGGSAVVHAACTAGHIVKLFSHWQILGDVYLS